MALEQDILTRTQANDTLVTTLNGKTAQINTKVAQSQTQVSDFVLPHREQSSFYRLSKNQSLDGTTGSVPNFWGSGTNVTYTKVQDVVSGIAWNTRTEEEKALLTAMGQENVVHYFKNFSIWRMDWTLDDHGVTLYQNINGGVATTIAAMTKLLSGSISNYWAHGATNQWKLTGEHSAATPYGYHNIHPIRQSPTGSMLFALPAALAGWHPLDARKWGFFPYIGDTQND